LKKYILFMIAGFILQGCVAKNQDMYAEDALTDRHERSVSVDNAVRTYIAPVAVIPGALVVGTIQGVGEVATYAAENPELIQQGIKTYQQVEYEQRIDREHGYRASADLRKTTNKNTTYAQNNRTDSEPLQYNYTEAASQPEPKQMHECVTYYVESKWVVSDDGSVGGDVPVVDFYKNRSAGSKIDCGPSSLGECTLYKIGHKKYTHTRNGDIRHRQVNYAVIRHAQQLEQSDTCFTDCSKGRCDSPSGVDDYISNNYYDTTSSGGPSLAQ
jgi:hypothetical protein